MTCETAPMDEVAARTLGRVAANGIELAYKTFGDAGAPPVVLIMGPATQRIAWPDELCEGLARNGLFVVRFDNRDVGESTHLRNLPPPRLTDIAVRRRRRRHGRILAMPRGQPAAVNSAIPGRRLTRIPSRRAT